VDAEFIRELFQNFRPVSVRRMFGGAGIYADDVMFALLSSGGTIYLKVNEINEPDFVRENLPPFEHKMNGVKRAMMSYRKMPERLYDDPDELALWARKALQAAQLKAAPKRNPGKSSKRKGR
jgi:DNA transformation protein and related proteins